MDKIHKTRTIRSRMLTTRFERRLWSILGFVVVVMLPVGVAIAEPIETSRLLAVMDRTVTDGDQLPLEGDYRFRIHSSRLLYSDDASSHWVIDDNGGRFCVVTRYEDPDRVWVIGSSCQAQGLFRESGLPLMVYTSRGGSDVLVVPDGYHLPENLQALREIGADMPEQNIVILPFGRRPFDLVLHGSRGTVLRAFLGEVEMSAGR
jgi:hypothetical protein